MEEQYLKNLFKALEIIVLGMGTVFIALAFFAFVIWLMTTIDEQYNKYKIRNYSKKVELKEVNEAHNDEIIAVIAATAFIIMNKPVKIHKIRFLANTKGNGWASSGKNNLMSSHFIKRD